MRLLLKTCNLRGDCFLRVRKGACFLRETNVKNISVPLEREQLCMTFVVNSLRFHLLCCEERLSLSSIGLQGAVLAAHPEMHF